MTPRNNGRLWRTLWTAAATIAGVGGVLLVAAFLAEPLDLGLAEEFVLYRWFDLPRSAAAYLGLGLGGTAAAIMAALRLHLSRRMARNIAQNASLVLSSVVAGVLALEVAVRLHDGISLWPPRNLVAAQTALLTIQTANEYHPILGWVLKPGTRVAPEDPDASFTIGEHGVRMNSPVSRPLPTGALLAVGDSYTAGSEVGDRHSWPAYLERILGEPVVNGGVGGWATDQIVLRAEELIPVVQPHTAIVSFYQDDILRAGFRVYGGANKPWFSVENGRLVHHNNPVPVFTGKPEEVGGPLLGYLHLATWVLDRVGYGDWWRRANTSYVDASNDPVQATCSLISRLARQTAEAGIRLLLVVQHGGNDRAAALREPKYAKAVVNCARESDIETIDTWEALARVNRDDLDAYRRLFVLHDDGQVYSHMSAEGNAFIARLIEERLGRGR